MPGLATAETAAIFRQESTTHSAYIEQVFGGITAFTTIGETQQVPVGVPSVTNTLTSVVLDYAKSLPISKNLFDDNMHSVWEKSVRDFALKARIARDKSAFNLFNKGFSTQLTADGVSLFNAAHPLINSSATQSNTFSGGTSALSNTSLQNGITAMETMRDQSGEVIGAAPSVLLVPPALFTTAIQLTKSVLVAGGGNNDVNVFRSEYGFEVHKSPYLSAAAGGSDTAWFLLGSNHNVTRIVRQGLQTALTPWEISDNRTYTYQGNFREVVKCADYAGAIGFVGV